MKKLVIDTSIVIDFLRVKDKSDTLLYKVAEEDLYLSIISHTELYAGKSVWEKSDIKEALDKIVNGMTIIPLEIATSTLAGQIRAQKGKPLIDSIIAATAKHLRAELITLNTKDFQGIDGLSLYRQDT